MKQDKAILTETGIKHNDQWFYKVKDVGQVEFDIFYDPADNSLI